MRYLICGGAGFLGSHLCDRLLEARHDVTILDRFTTGRRENIEHLRSEVEVVNNGDGGKTIRRRPDRVRILVGDCCDRATVMRCVSESDAVFHLASVVGVKLVIRRPLLAATEIVQATANVLAECAAQHKPVLWTSSSEVYGKSPELPCREDADVTVGPPQELRWSYAAAKLQGEFLARAYWETTGLPVVTVRLFNTVGPRQLSEYGMVLPTFVRQALRGEPLTVYGDGTQTRCFCHVWEVADGLLRLMECREAAGEIVNLGGATEITIRRLAELVISHTDHYGQWSTTSYAEAYGRAAPDVGRRVPDLAKAKRLIGWEPKIGLGDIIGDVAKYERGRLSETACA